MNIEDLIVEDLVDFQILDSSEGRVEFGPTPEATLDPSDANYVDPKSRIVVEKYGDKSSRLYDILQAYRKEKLDSETTQSVAVDESDDEDHGYLVGAFKVDKEDLDTTIYYYIKSAYTPEYSYVTYAMIYKEYNPERSIPTDDMLTWPVIIRDSVCSDP